jgi:hypothetical protein
MANRLRKCGHCKKMHPVDKGHVFSLSFFCSIDHAVAHSHAKGVKALKSEKAAVKSSNRKALKEFNQRDIRWQHKQTQPAFNRMRVLQELLWFKDRNLEPACISCGKPLGGDQWCCGHFKTVSAQSVLRYDPKNTFLQHNRNCNMGLSGDIYGSNNTHGYVQGLKNRFGEEEGQQIIDHCESPRPPAKWQWEELECKRKEFNKEIRRVESLL